MDNTHTTIRTSRAARDRLAALGEHVGQPLGTIVEILSFAEVSHLVQIILAGSNTSQTSVEVAGEMLQQAHGRDPASVIPGAWSGRGVKPVRQRGTAALADKPNEVRHDG